MSEELKLHNNDRIVLAEHFAGKTFNDKIVVDFCKRNKIAVTDAGSVEDFIYAVDYDKRMTTLLPLILEELSKLEYAGEYVSDQERKRISDANDDISEHIAQLLEDNGMWYRETNLLQSLAGDVAQIFATAERRINNMGATVLAEIAQEKLGDPLTLRALSNERAQIADRKAKKIEKEEIKSELCNTSAEHNEKNYVGFGGASGGGAVNYKNEAVEETLQKQVKEEKPVVYE